MNILILSDSESPIDYQYQSPTPILKKVIFPTLTQQQKKTSDWSTKHQSRFRSNGIWNLNSSTKLRISYTVRKHRNSYFGCFRMYKFSETRTNFRFVRNKPHMSIHHIVPLYCVIGWQQVPFWLKTHPASPLIGQSPSCCLETLHHIVPLNCVIHWQ